MLRFIAVLPLSLALACSQSQPAAPPPASPSVDIALLPGAQAVDEFTAAHPAFDQYWYQGVAELSRYELSQARYGEQFPGEAVLVYVTEDFLTDVQTKHEFGDATNAVPVLKLNAYRRFYTGIYPYSILTSVFSPVSSVNAAALKLSVSVQEWCGMTYQQFNRRDDAYAVQLHSYFQAEADQEFAVDGLLEDELWTRIRRAPEALPVGEQRVVPAGHALRLMHSETAAERAVLSLAPVAESTYAAVAAQRYTVDYPEFGRTVVIEFEAAFPHAILGWTETQRGRGTTTARRTDAVMLDYWSRHGLDDAPYRALLGLEY